MTGSNTGTRLFTAIRRLGGGVGLSRSLRGLSRAQRRAVLVACIASLAVIIWLATGAWIWGVGVVGVTVLFVVVWMLIGWIARRVERARAGDWGASTHADRGALLEEGEDHWRMVRQQLREAGDRPLYLLIGEPGAGKTTSLLRAGLRFPRGVDPLGGQGGTRMYDCFRTESATVLDTAGRYAVGGGDAESGSRISASDRIQWEQFLAELRRYRPRAPINGVVVVVPMSCLLEDDEPTRQAKSHALLAALNDLREHLEIRFPVTVMISKADRLGGFAEFFDEASDTDFDQQLLGVSTPADRPWDAPFDAAAFERVFAQLVSRLRRRRLGLAAESAAPETRGRLFSFPEELAGVAEPLLDTLRILFPPSEMAPPHFFRGAFLTSSMRREASVFAACSRSMPWPVEGSAPDHEDLRARFAHDFYVRKVFEEAGLLRPTMARELWSLVVNRIASGGCIALVLFGLVWVTVTGWRDYQDVQEIEASIEGAINFEKGMELDTLKALAGSIRECEAQAGVGRPLDLIGQGGRADLADAMKRLWYRRAYRKYLLDRKELIAVLGRGSEHFQSVETRERWQRAMEGLNALRAEKVPGDEQVDAMWQVAGAQKPENNDVPKKPSELTGLVSSDHWDTLKGSVETWEVEDVFPRKSDSWPWVYADDPAANVWSYVRWLADAESDPCSRPPAVPPKDGFGKNGGGPRAAIWSSVEDWFENKSINLENAKDKLIGLAEQRARGLWPSGLEENYQVLKDNYDGLPYVDDSEPRDAPSRDTRLVDASGALDKAVQDLTMEDRRYARCWIKSREDKKPLGNLDSNYSIPDLLDQAAIIEKAAGNDAVDWIREVGTWISDHQKTADKADAWLVKGDVSSGQGWPEQWRTTYVSALGEHVKQVNDCLARLSNSEDSPFEISDFASDCVAKIQRAKKTPSTLAHSIAEKIGEELEEIARNSFGSILCESLNDAQGRWEGLFGLSDLMERLDDVLDEKIWLENHIRTELQKVGDLKGIVTEAGEVEMIVSVTTLDTGASISIGINEKVVTRLSGNGHHEPIPVPADSTIVVKWSLMVDGDLNETEKERAVGKLLEDSDERTIKFDGQTAEVKIKVNGLDSKEDTRDFPDLGKLCKGSS